MRETPMWGSGDAYEPYVGRWSRLVAVRFIDWLSGDPGATWVDLGCGTGAVTQAILDNADPSVVVGMDPSHAQVTFAAHRLDDDRARVAVADAQCIATPGDSFDHVVSGLVLNFIPDPAAAMAEMRRVARPGGRVAAYVWDYAGKMEMMRFFWDTARELDPAAVALDEATRFPLCAPEPLERLWEQTGFSEIDVVPLDVDTIFTDFDDLWGPLLGGQAPAPSYNMSLSPGAREALRELLRARLPLQDDGSIALTARAWAVRGTKKAL